MDNIFAYLQKMIISCGLFCDSVCAPDHIVSNGLMINEYEVAKTLKRSSYSLNEVGSWYLPGGTEEDHQKLEDSGAHANILTYRLPNTRLVRYP